MEREEESVVINVLIGFWWWFILYCFIFYQTNPIPLPVHYIPSYVTVESKVGQMAKAVHDAPM